MPIMSATASDVTKLIGDTKLLLVILSENNGVFRGQAMASSDHGVEEGKSQWWFGPILNFDSLHEMDQSAAAMAVEMRAEITYFVRVEPGEQVAKAAVMGTDDNGGYGILALGYMDMQAIEVVARAIQREAGDDVDNLVYLPDLLEPKIASPDAPSEEAAPTGPAFPEGTIVN